MQPIMPGSPVPIPFFRLGPAGGQPGQRQHQQEVARSSDDEETARKISECDRKLAQYRAALDAGANPATVAAWIAETEAEKASYALATRKPTATRPA